jgi:hypothetical protein
MMTPSDGELCRDNALGRAQSLFAADLGLDENGINCNLWRGSYNVVLELSGYNGAEDDSDVRVDVYMSTGLEQLPSWQCPMDDAPHSQLRWNTAASWSIDQTELNGAAAVSGGLPGSQIADPHAYVRGGYVVASFPAVQELRLIGRDPKQRGLVLEIAGSTWTGRIVQAQAGGMRIEDGLIAGRQRVDDVTQTLRWLGHCDGDGYDRAVAAIHEQADVSASPDAADSSQTCDALSFGLAFEAAQVTVGAMVERPANVECCPSGMAAIDCESVCGDGIVSGDETCDVAISLWSPGACPYGCPSRDACAPMRRSGVGCAAECVPAPTPELGARDGCCPKGGNGKSDPDCPSVCGNGVVEPDETCDPSAEPCPSCVSRDPCVEAVTSGAAKTCDLRCELHEVSSCQNEDGCCPSGCNNTNDMDCVPRCGNGVLEDSETCESGSDSPCDTTCDDHDACTSDKIRGTVERCNLICTHTARAPTVSPDGCCPTDGNAAIDGDCKPVCGNGVLEPSETCPTGDDAGVAASDCPQDCKP